LIILFFTVPPSPLSLFLESFLTFGSAVGTLLLFFFYVKFKRTYLNFRLDTETDPVTVPPKHSPQTPPLFRPPLHPFFLLHDNSAAPLSFFFPPTSQLAQILLSSRAPPPLFSVYVVFHFTPSHPRLGSSWSPLAVQGFSFLQIPFMGAIHPPFFFFSPVLPPFFPPKFLFLVLFLKPLRIP